MAKIIDTHSHILPGIDDGAGSWKEALCMLKTAQAQGIRRVIATPHWGGPFGYTDPVQIRELCFTLDMVMCFVPVALLFHFGLSR